MFFEISGEDMAFGYLYREERADQLVYSTKGVKIFKLKKPSSRETPYPHRFLVNPPTWFRGACSPLKVGIWYAHVYQTKLEIQNILRSLNSKAIARELRRICRPDYLP